MKKLLLLLPAVFFLNAHAQLCLGPRQIFKVMESQSLVGAQSITSADFNGDGKTDIATANFISTNTGAGSNVSVLLGTGTGSFMTADTFAVDNGAQQIISADFNHDGKVDLATVNYSKQHNTSSVSVLLGTGTGSFLPVTNFSSGFAPASITSSDFNGDGFADFVTANPQLKSVYVSLNTGTGNFVTPTSFTVAGYPMTVIHGDFNGDGKTDLATANGDSNNVSILLGTGTGSFGPATSFTAGVWSWSDPVANHNGGISNSLLSTDFNGDGKADLAVTHNDTTIVSILLGNGAGSFGAATDFQVNTSTVAQPGPSPSQLTSADINGDGKADLVSANPYNSIFPGLVETNNTISVLLGNGAGSFGTPTSYTLGARPQWVLSSDFNGDGKIDLAVADTDVSVLLNCTVLGIEKFASNEQVHVYPNPNNGTFTIETNGTAKQSMQIFDVNGRMVLNQAINGKTSIDAGSLNEGVYTISIISAEGTVTKKLVIVR